MSPKFANAVVIDLQQPPPLAGLIVGLHLLGLGWVLLVPRRLGLIVALLIVVSGWCNLRRWRAWPWRSLIWKPAGALWLVDRDGQPHAASWSGNALLSRWLLIPTLVTEGRSWAGRSWRPLLWRWREPDAFRCLAVRLRCESARRRAGIRMPDGP